MKNQLIPFAIIYNALNILFIFHMKSLHEEGNFIYHIVFPVFWFIAFILFYDLCLHQMNWLKNNSVKGLLLTCFCVPIIPIILIEFFS